MKKYSKSTNTIWEIIVSELRPTGRQKHYSIGYKVWETLSRENTCWTYQISSRPIDYFGNEGDEMGTSNSWKSKGNENEN